MGKECILKHSLSPTSKSHRLSSPLKTPFTPNRLPPLHNYSKSSSFIGLKCKIEAIFLPSPPKNTPKNEIKREERERIQREGEEI